MYYISLYHTHKIVVFAFLAIYAIKTALLLAGRENSLSSFSSKVKVPERAVSFLFLITGILLLFEAAEIRTLFLFKIVVIILAIPIAVIAFKRLSKPLALLAMVMLAGGYGLAEMNKYRMIHRADLPKSVIVDASSPDYQMVLHGKALYNTQCVNCHGEMGDLQMSGARNLKTSAMGMEEIVARINEGRMTMPPYIKHFTAHEIRAIAEYAKSFQNGME